MIVYEHKLFKAYNYIHPGKALTSYIHRVNSPTLQCKSRTGSSVAGVMKMGNIVPIGGF